ncbi:unnamed protein product, partial [Leptidea sinapis]
LQIILFLGLSLAYLATSAPTKYDEGKGRYPLPQVNGGHSNVKVQSSKIKGHIPELELQLRKGEFICNGKICELRPGEIPDGCNGKCQYKI